MNKAKLTYLANAAINFSGLSRNKDIANEILLLHRAYVSNSNGSVIDKQQALSAYVEGIKTIKNLHGHQKFQYALDALNRIGLKTKDKQLARDIANVLDSFSNEFNACSKKIRENQGLNQKSWLTPNF